MPFTPHMAVWLVIIVALLCVSALVSGSETAFFSLSPAQLESIRTKESASTKAALRLLDEQDYLLATILVLNNLVNICIVILCNNLLDSLVLIHSSAWEFAIKTVLVTFLLLLFGEIMPKVFANYNSERFASMMAVPMLGARKLFTPLTFILVKYSTGLAEKRGHRTDISVDELSDALEMTEQTDQEERQMLSGIVQLANSEVRDIMHPRLDIAALSIEENFGRVKELIISSGYSRIPVYRDTLDNIEGVLYVKDLLPHISRADDFHWNTLLRPAYFTPEHNKLGDMLEEFRSRKVHVAIVVDEYGSTVGLITLEDILEEIVGEISDESDIDESFFHRLGDGIYLFEGKTHIGDLERVLGLSEGTFDDCKGQAETIAGMMLERKREFLRKGDKMTFHSVRFTVESVEGRKADKIKVEQTQTH